MATSREDLRQTALCRWHAVFTPEDGREVCEGEDIEWWLSCWHSMGRHGATSVEDASTAYKCCGWAQDTLIERGWDVETYETPGNDITPPHADLKITKRKCNDGKYRGDTLLDCFLAAIIATNPVTEQLQETGT